MTLGLKVVLGLRVILRCRVVFGLRVRLWGKVVVIVLLGLVDT